MTAHGDQPPVADADPDARPVCPHCLVPVTDLDHFCPKCGRPITSHAMMGPMESIRASGWAYGNAVDRPRLVAVIGLWLIFGSLVFPLGFLGLLVAEDMLASDQVVTGLGEPLPVGGPTDRGTGFQDEGWVLAGKLLIAFAYAGLCLWIPIKATCRYRAGEGMPDADSANLNDADDVQPKRDASRDRSP